MTASWTIEGMHFTVKIRLDLLWLYLVVVLGYASAKGITCANTRDDTRQRSILEKID